MQNAFSQLSLVCHVVHATMVCPLGKAFMCGLFQVPRMLHAHGQPRHLNLITRADIAWWDSLLSTWPRVSVHQFLMLGQPDRHLFSEYQVYGGVMHGHSHTGSSSHGPTAMACPELPYGTGSNHTYHCDVGGSREGLFILYHCPCYLLL